MGLCQNECFDAATFSFSHIFIKLPVFPTIYKKISDCA